MKFLFFLLVFSSMAFAEPAQVCNGTVTLSESDEGPVFSGTLTEGDYTNKFSYIDDDGFLTLIAANLAVLNSNNQFTSAPQNYRISTADKNMIVGALRRQASYNQEALEILRDTSLQQPEDAPTVADVEALEVKVQELIRYVEGRGTNVPAAEWNSKVGKYVKEQMRGPRVYQSKIPNFQGKLDTHGLCGNTVRCPCSINSSPFNRGRLCGIDYENPQPNTGEFARCSSFNMAIQSGSASSTSSSSSSNSSQVNPE